MSLVAANHFVVRGSGVDGTVDTAGIAGDPVVSLTVDGREVHVPEPEVRDESVVLRGTVEQVPDSHTVDVVVVIPRVNLDDASPAATASAVACAGFAVLVTRRTSIGGPRLVAGPLQEYELRPLAVTASAVAS